MIDDVEPGVRIGRRAGTAAGVPAGDAMTERVDVHQHLWPEPLLAALSRRDRPPLLRRSGAGWMLRIAGEPDWPVDPGDHDPVRRALLVERDGLDRGGRGAVEPARHRGAAGRRGRGAARGLPRGGPPPSGTACRPGRARPSTGPTRGPWPIASTRVSSASACRPAPCAAPGASARCAPLLSTARGARVAALRAPRPGPVERSPLHGAGLPRCFPPSHVDRVQGVGTIAGGVDPRLRRRPLVRMGVYGVDARRDPPPRGRRGDPRAAGAGSVRLDTPGPAMDPRR